MYEIIDSDFFIDAWFVCLVYVSDRTYPDLCVSIDANMGLCQSFLLLLSQLVDRSVGVEPQILPYR